MAEYIQGEGKEITRLRADGHTSQVETSDAQQPFVEMISKVSERPMRISWYKYILVGFTVSHKLWCIICMMLSLSFATFSYFMRSIRTLRQGLKSGQCSGDDVSIEALEGQDG